MDDTKKILICGDICPTDDTLELFESGDPKSLFNGLLPLFRKSNLLIANLECPLTDSTEFVNKTGPSLKAKKKYGDILKKSGFDILGLANNHIRDFGDKGVIDTIQICHENGIRTLGAGAEIQKAQEPLIINIGDWKIGIIALAEEEFNASSKTSAGANIFSPYESYDHIKELKNQVDYVIILNHGGVEYYKYPSPLLQQKSRKMIDSGADIVLSQHSHCIGTTEQYKNRTIVYGQGNTLYGYRANNPSWNEGLIIEICLSKNNNMKVNFIPIQNKGKGIDILDESMSKIRIKSFLDDSKNILNSEFIIQKWSVFCNSKKALYFPLLLGLGRVSIFVNRIMNNRIIKFLYSKKKLNTTLNIVRCESHREVILTQLKEFQDR